MMFGNVGVNGEGIRWVWHHVETCWVCSFTGLRDAKLEKFSSEAVNMTGVPSWEAIVMKDAILNLWEIT